MSSRQKSWRIFNELIPGKGTSSLCENLKAMKKAAHLENAEKEFSKIFLVNELQWLLWAFKDNSENK
ncbi:4465_t:CDS:2 [Entrophospora sp. SA101]|nr:13655_t:CDS:2 [Entrophospora sp. SA101]CAJ0874491.1 4465_t:CDS:2 [Entrophospora sp. SA101]